MLTNFSVLLLRMLCSGPVSLKKKTIIIKSNIETDRERERERERERDKVK